MISFYLATRIENWAVANEIADALHGRGWVQTYRWTGNGDNGNVENLSHALKRKVSEEEVRGVIDAEVLVVLAPGGRGTHCEIGIALGTNKPIFIWAKDENDIRSSDGQITTFYHHPLVTRCICKKDDAVRNILAWSKKVVTKEMWSRL